MERCGRINFRPQGKGDKMEEKTYWVDFQASIKVKAKDDEEAKEIVRGFFYDSNLYYTEISDVEEIKE